MIVDFFLAWISGPWAPLAIVALFVAAGLAVALLVAVHDAVIWFISRVRA